MSRPDRKALIVIIDAARRREAHEAFAASSLPALARATTATLVAPSCWTVPCIASLLTGLFPSEHGMQWPLDRGPLRAPTLVDLALRAGRTFRLISGNRLYAPPLIGLPEHCLTFPTWHHWRPTAFLGRTLGLMDYGGRAILREVRRMADARDLPDLMLLHLQEAHHPYLPPPPGISPAARARYALGHLAYYLSTSAQVWESAARADERAWARARSRYCACLHYAVTIVEGVLRAYQDAGALENALVIITADHGEHLGEHGLADHQASLHEELVSCPCALIAPGLAPGGVIPGQFQHTDLLLTLCRYLGIPTAGYRPSLRPLDLLDPASHAGGHEFAFMEWTAWGEEQFAMLQRRNPGYDLRPLNRDLAAVRTARWKYIRADEGAGALYDLHADPGEQFDLSGRDPVRAADLAAALDDRLATVRGDGATSGETRGPADLRRRLRDLGYI